MPFTKRSVEPVNIRQGALSNHPDVSLGEEHEVIISKSYTQILLQLSQLSTYANEIFKELSQECQGVINRSQKLKTRVWEIEQKSNELNVLETPLPESSLEIVGAAIREATPVQPEQETGLFTAASRPDSVQRLYSKADRTPRAVYAALGPQGWKAAKRFCLMPCLKQPGETKYTIAKLEKAPYIIRYERNERLKPPRPRTHSAAPRPRSCADILDYSQQTSRSTLPTPEEHALRSAKSQPSVLVSIDTSFSAFERFAETRASLRNIQSHEQSNSMRLSRDARRQTIGGTNSYGRKCVCEQPATISTEKLLEPDTNKTDRAKRKNPDLYIEDTVELFSRDRSRSKDKKESVIKKLVKRSKSLPRNIGREKCRETLVPPDFYDITPQHTLIVAQNGAYLNEKDEKIYTNFYGAPNTELPSPRRIEEMRKSKSDHQLSEKGRSKSTSAAEELKLKHVNGRRPRSVSAERGHGTHSDEKHYNSLSKTFSGIFNKGRKSKTLSHPPSLSRDSLNTVFSKEGEEMAKRQMKRNTLLSTQITLRKRDSKATTSSSGRWSGSERFSLDSDGMFGLSQRESRASADRDSALGADINDNRKSFDGDKLLPADETNSLYSVDTDGFYTTMHTDIHISQGKTSESPFSEDIDINFGNLSMVSSSSTCTSTHTLNETEKSTPKNRNSSQGSSIGSYPDSDQAEEISQRVASKVEAGRKINRYSLVMGSFEDINGNDEKDIETSEETRSQTTLRGHTNLKQSKTYESELDLVLEDLSESDTVTVHSDSESVCSLTVAQTDDQSDSRGKKTHESVLSEEQHIESPPVSNNLLRYKLLNGCTNYQKLTHSVSGTPLATHSKSGTSLVEQNDIRSCKSLPRNLKNGVSGTYLNGLVTALDNMGSWPRKFSRVQSEIKPETLQKSDDAQSTQPSHSKRRSLSPGKLKSSQSTEKTEKIHSLIEEARRMSSISDKGQSLTPPKVIVPSTYDSQLSQDIELVSPYASSDVAMSPPNDSSDYFRRQRSYKIACSNQVTPRKILPRANSEDPTAMRRNYSYRQANKVLRAQNSESIIEHQILDTSGVAEDPSLARVPSYKLAQQTSFFERSSRAPSYRKAVELNETDSGLGSGDLTSSSSTMTSSSESNNSDSSNGRQSSYRTATENGSKTVELPPPALHNRVIKECMRGVYENEEIHLSKPLVVSNSEMVKIGTANHSKHHYSVPKIPAQPISFHPHYVNVKVGVQSKTAFKKSLQPSKSAPTPQESENSTSKLSLESGKCMTPPARSFSRRARPMSSYIPKEGEEAESVPQNRLMLPKYNQSTFPSMEMLKREERAVMSVLGKIRRSTRPLSYVQTDI
ncbi:serine-rich adhesin for platelets-like [Watersipora subatra]|uniref:serine-rich adhesin for platelets-like n=1 Tax=Watersipora subatra TaxID=2589382 RepID=UPI00355B32B8